jgi:opacity protein-like surface antigen
MNQLYVFFKGKIKPNLKAQDFPFEQFVDAKGKIHTDKLAAAMSRVSVEGVSSTQIQNALKATLTPEIENQIRIDANYKFKDVNGEDLKNHFTAYIQPSYNLGNGLAVFGKVGYSHADLEIKTAALSNQGTLNKKDDLEGYLVGLGVQKNIDKSMFVRFEANYTDYDSVAYTNSSGTRFTADPELWTAKISIGTSF